MFQPHDLSVLVVGVISTLIGGLAGVLASDIALGLVVGPAQEPAWIGCVVISRWLAFRGKLPWKLMGFLDDAHRLGLLRTAGSVYQFRHADLQDHLAKPPETAAPASTMQKP